MNLKTFITESLNKEYHYRIKLAADCTSEHLDKLESILQKYNVVNVSDFNRLPIQENPQEFVRLKGAHFTSEVCSTDVTLKYPINQRILEVYVAANLGMPHERVLAYGISEPRRIESDLAAERLEQDQERMPSAEDSALAQADQDHTRYSEMVEQEELEDDLTLYGEAYNSKFLEELKRIRAEKGDDYFRCYPTKDEIMGDDLRAMWDQVHSNGKGMAPEPKHVSVNHQNLGH